MTDVIEHQSDKNETIMSYQHLLSELQERIYQLEVLEGVIFDAQHGDLKLRLERVGD